MNDFYNKVHELEKKIWQYDWNKGVVPNEWK
jgi:hypothetical protein